MKPPLASLQDRETALLAQLRQSAPETHITEASGLQATVADLELQLSAARVTAPDEKVVRAREKLSNLDHERDKLRASLATWRKELLAAAQASEHARAVIREAFGEAGVKVGSRQDLSAQRQRAQEMAAEAVERSFRAGADVRRFEEREKETNSQLRDALRNIESIQQSRRALGERILVLQERWTSAGMSTEPTAATSWPLHDRVADRTRRLRDLEQMLSDTVRRYEAWLRNDERRRLEDVLRDTLTKVGAANSAELEARLSTGVRDAEDTVERLRRTQEAALRIADELKVKADQYAQSVLEPLSATIQSYSRALLSSAEDSLYYRARFRANGSELKPGIVQRLSSSDRVTREIDPNLFFSEGQLSALSVSSLLAASTTFQWSRWPALLMDDPLQHNDVIHASAFIDLLRRLVQKLGYQAVLSTHDSDEAEFIARKCESARIPFSLCELRPSGSRGVSST